MDRVQRGSEVRYGALVPWYSWSDDERISIADLARSPADGSPLVGQVTIPLPAEYGRPSLVTGVVTTRDGDAVYAAQDAVVRTDASARLVLPLVKGPRLGCCGNRVSATPAAH
jgi:hypothetical protein